MATVTVSSGETYTISAGQSDTNDLVQGVLIVDGIANATTIVGGGSATVNLGGSATSSLINGGAETVSSGGSTSFETIAGLETVLLGGSTSSDTIINLSGLFVPTLVLSGGTADFTTISSGGSESVLSGGSADNTTIGGLGSLAVSSGGSAVMTTIGSGGSGTVAGGGSATSTTIDGGGRLIVNSASVANSNTISSGGSLSVSLSGAANFNTIDGGGSLSLGLNAGATSTTILSGGSETVDGGHESATTIFGGGSETVDGFAFFDIISGGSETVMPGALTGFATIDSGGSLSIVANVNYQGEASDTTINSGGSETVSAGGFDSAATISGGGSLTVLGGITRSATIDSGGSLTVSGGVASATTINSGGVETVLSGGSATSTTINGSGAVLDLLSGAVVSGGIAFVGSGGQLQIAGTPPTSASAISGFTASGDFIDLTSLAFSGTTSVGFSSAADMLTVIEGGGSATVQLDSENYTGISWVAQSDGVSGTDIAAACYCRGTLILTDRGEVPVEDLAIGDKVATISCEAKPIRWIGRRSYAARFVAGNRAVLPVRVAAGAIGEGVPARDLFVSPEHALFIPGSSPGTGVLVPARQLVNGASIVQTEAVEQIDYFNIELEAHDIIFAEAMPAESYVDCDNRYMFQNASEFAALYPGDDRPAWQFCAKRLEEGSAALPAIRAALLARAEALGYRRTGDPDLHLIVDGEIVRAQAVENGTCRFTIPAGSGAVSLASRSAVPAEVEAGSHDRRRLGVPLQAIFLREAGLCTEIGHGHPSLREGFHDDEDGHRWTDGCARLPDELLRPFAGEVGLEVRLIKPGLRYPLEAAAAPARIRRPPAARG